MSADSGNEVPDDERLEWLLSLNDDQFKRMQKVARGPVYTRRQIAKYLGTGAVAALAGGASTGAVAADADTNDQYGDVGTPSDRVDVFADGVNTATITDSSSSTTYNIDSLASGGAAVPTIRVGLDGSEAVAYGQSGEIARSTNHASVIQSAIDEIATSDPGHPEKNMAVGGVIEGNGNEYDITQNITVKSRMRMQNFHLDAGGQTGFDILSSSGTLHGLQLNNIIANNSGDSHGINVEPVFGCIFINVAAGGNGGSGIVCRGGIGSRWYSPYTIENSAPGFVIDNSTANAGNDNIIYGGVLQGPAPGSTTPACKLTSSTGATEQSDNNLIHGVDFGNTDNGLEVEQGHSNLTIENCWVEGSGGVGIHIGSTGQCRDVTIRDNKAQSIQIDNADNVDIIRNGAEANASLDITIGSAATATYLENNDLNGGSVTNNGSHTQYGGRRSSLAVGQDVTASRSFGTTYTNSNDYDIMVLVEVEKASGSAGDFNFQMYVAQTGPTPTDTRVDMFIRDGIESADRVRYMGKAVVPAGYEYQVESFGDESINTWYERPLTEGV